MKKIFNNKSFIELISIIIWLIIFALIIWFTIWYIKNNEINNNISCYWTTQGIICGGKLGSDNND